MLHVRRRDFITLLGSTAAAIAVVSQRCWRGEGAIAGCRNRRVRIAAEVSDAVAPRREGHRQQRSSQDSANAITVPKAKAC
jgi:hypothetical protein